MKKLKKNLVISSIIVAMIFTFISCGGNPTQEAEECVTKALTALQSGDIEGAGRYMNTDALTKYTNMDLSEDDIQKEQLEKIIEAFFTNLNYEIISSEEQKDGSVQVEVNVSNVDREMVVDEWADEVMRIGLKYCDLDDAEIKELVDSMELSDVSFYSLPKKATQEIVDSSVTCVKKAVEDDKLEENRIVVTAKKTDGSWKLDLDKGQKDVIFGGFTKAMKAMNPHN